MLNFRWARRFAGLWEGRKRQPYRRARGALLTLEVLEARLVPSTLVVSVATGTGAGSLPAQITQADTDAASGISDTINFTGLASGSTVTLTATQTLSAASGAATITIDGTGADVTIKGDGTTSVFAVSSGASVDFNELTVTDGIAPKYGGGPSNKTFTAAFAAGVSTIKVSSTTSLADGDPVSGSGIAPGTTITGVNTSAKTINLSIPTTTLESTSVTLTASEAAGSNSEYTVSTTTEVSGNGGAIDNSGTVSVTNCVFYDNAVNGDGGAIYNASGSLAYVGGSDFGILQSNYTSLATDVDPEFDANYATGSTSYGGAICNAGTMTLQNSVLLGNFITNTTSGDGAGLANISGGTMTIANSTIADGTAGGSTSDGKSVGGGIYNDGAMTLNSSTIYGNRVYFVASRADEEGSGIFNDAAGALTVSNSTIANNNGGIDNKAGGSVLLMNSIVFGNLHVVSPYEETDLDGTFSASSENNLIGDIALNQDGDATGITNGVNGNQVGAYGASPDYTPSVNPYLLPIAYYIGSVPTMPVISASSNPSPAVTNPATTGSAGGPLTTLTAEVDPGAATLTLNEGSLIAITPGGEYVLEIGTTTLTVAYSSGNTFTIVGGYSGASPLAAGASVYLADYQNGDPRVSSSGATDVGAAEYFDFDFTATGQPPPAVDINESFSVTLSATDQSGAGLPNVPIGLTLDGNAAAVLSGPITGDTDSTGSVTYTGLSVNTAGTYALTATVITVSSLGASQNTSGAGSGSIPDTTTAITQVSDDFNVVEGPGTLTFTTEPPSSITAGATFSPVVSVVDPLGSDVSGDTVSITISSGTLIGTATGTTNSSGVVTFTGLSVDLAGTYTLTATAAATDTMDATTGTSSTFVIVAGAVASSGLTFVTEPSPIIAGATMSPAVTVQAVDQYGNPISGQAVSLSISPSTTLNGSGPVTTNVSGQAVFSSLSVDSIGTYTLTATAGSASAISTSFVVSSAAPAKLSFISQPSSTTADSVISPVTMQIVDAFGNPVANAAISIVSSPRALTSGTTTLTSNAAGQVVFNNFVENITGTYTLTASSAGLGNVLSNSFTISAAAATTVSFVTEPSSTTAGAVLNPITVLVEDTYGNDVPAASVSIGIAPGTLSTGSGSIATNAQGQAVFTTLSEDTTGTYSLTAQVAGLAAVGSNSFTISAAGAAKISYLTQPSSTTAGAVINPVSVQVADQFGNPVTGAAVTIGIAPGTLSAGTLVLTSNSSGQVAFSNLQEDSIGTYTLTATTPGVTSIRSNSFVISSAAAQALSFISQPSNTTAGSIISPVTVLAVDAFNNPVANVLIGISSAPNALSAGTTPLTTNSSGEVVFNDLVQKIAGTYTLTAAASGLASIFSNQFTVTAAAASKLSFVTEPSNTVAGSPINPVVVQVADTYGNPVTGTVIGIAISATTLSSGTTPLTSGANGQVSFNDLIEDLVGNYTLTASASGLANVSSSSFSITAAVATAQLSFLSQPSSTIAGATINAVTVKLADKYNNPLIGYSIGIGLSTGSLSTGTTPLSSNALGEVVFSDLSEDKAGTYTLTASSSGYTSVSSNQFTISSAASTATLSFISEPSSTTAGSILNAVTIQAADKYGNVVPNITIGIAISPGSLSAGTTPIVTNSAGQSVFSNLVEDVAGTYSLTASASGLASVPSSSFTITPAVTTAQLAFLSQPSSTIAGTILNAITVRLADKYSNPLVGYSIGIGLSTGALSTGTTPLSSNALGEVVFSDLSEDKSGTYSLIASSSGYTSVSSNQFTISPAATTATLSFISQPNSTTAGLVLNAVTIQATDEYGNVVPNITIGIALSPGSLSSGTTPIKTNAAGQSVFGDLVEDVAGTYSLIASATGLASTPSDSFTISPAAAYKLTFLTEPTGANVAGSTLNATTVQIADRFGNEVPNVSISIALSPGALSTGTTPLVSNAQGQVTFSDLSEDTSGTYSLIASSSEVANATSGSFTITSAQAATLTFLTQPSSVAVNATLNAITLEAIDQFGNRVVSGSVSIALASGLLNGTTLALTNSTGEAVFTNLTVPDGGLYTLMGSSGTASAVSNPFAVTSSADKLTYLTEPNSTTAGTTLNAVVVQLTDPAGDLLPGVAIKIGISSGTLSGTTAAVSNSLGEVTFGTLSVTKDGSYTLVATSTGIPSSTSSLFTITSGGVAKMTFVSQPSTTTAGTIIAAVTVLAVDQYGNPVSGSTIGISTTYGQLSGTTALTTNAAGETVYSTLSESVVGTCVLTAASSAPSVNSNPFAVTPGTSYALSFAAQPSSTTAGAIISPISVKVVDKFGNPVAGVTVNLYTSINTIDGTTTAVSNAAGLAVFSNLYITKTATYTLSAGSGNLARATSNAFVISPAAAKLSIVTEPLGTTAGNSLGNVTVKLADAYGNLLVGTSVTVRLSSGTLAGTTTAATNTSGEVIFTNLAVMQTGSYTLIFAAPGATSITSSAFAITTAPPPHLVFSTPPTTTAPSTAMKSVVVQLDNANGTVLDQANVAVTIKISTGSLSGTLTVLTNAAGQAVFSNLEIASAGSYTFTATATVNGQTVSVTSGAFTVT